MDIIICSVFVCNLSIICIHRNILVCLSNVWLSEYRLCLVWDKTAVCEMHKNIVIEKTLDEVVTSSKVFSDLIKNVILASSLKLKFTQLY